ncbi:hypothetical protein RAH42_00615 [Pyramidobacter sp. YE332]|uniref:ornithine cyclodeaminase family domain n=1 Tax=unclassified Pyramidobacter TaxID=2632171 RepID=UPI00098F83AF|nr:MULTISPECIES: hypothetical protein [unclassified Pyramidobacter]OON88115.1 LOR/SDH bifunctional protein [Pyramidobacter sp. C12-8]WOL40160.1 hypothetical protein RAH42_00615 [Pyramidobacter sp. YE332]
MKFEMPVFACPDFADAKYREAGEVKCAKVEKKGVAPRGFYLTTHLPTFYRCNGTWQLPEHNSLNCVAVLKEGKIAVTEIRDLEVGDEVVLGRATDGSEGVLVYKEGFPESVYATPGRAVETAYTTDYEQLFAQLEYERDNGGYIVWVLGPSVVFDYDTRVALNHLAENGYISCMMGGNAMATHDLEGGFLGTALGQNIYTQENQPMGHYNHLDLLNEVRTAGSTKKFINEGHVKDGIIKTLVSMNVPLVLAGSIRDDGPLPEVIGDTDKALTEMKKHLDKATLIIGIATMLHSLSVANMASSYHVRKDGAITPVYMYTIDITENVTNKVVAARERIAVVPMNTNVQDFVVNCERALIGAVAREQVEAMEVPAEEFVVVKNAQREEAGK